MTELPGLESVEEFKATDWHRIDQCVLMNCPGIGTPRAIDDMTLSEIALILTFPEPSRPMGGLPF